MTLFGMKDLADAGFDRMVVVPPFALRGVEMLAAALASRERRRALNDILVVLTKS